MILSHPNGLVAQFTGAQLTAINVFAYIGATSKSDINAGVGMNIGETEISPNVLALAVFMEHDYAQLGLNGAVFKAKCQDVIDDLNNLEGEHGADIALLYLVLSKYEEILDGADYASESYDKLKQKMLELNTQ